MSIFIYIKSEILFMMSQLVWYSLSLLSRHSTLKNIIEWMDTDVVRSSITYKICFQRSNPDIYVPLDIWKLLFWLVCEDKCSKRDHISLQHARCATKIEQTQIEHKDVLYWWDNYISSPGLRGVDEVRICKDFDEVRKSLCEPESNSKIRPDLACTTFEVELENNHLCVPHNGDFLLGIEKNSEIESIRILFNGIHNKKVYSKDFFEFTVGAKTYISIRNLMPIFLTELTFTSTKILIKSTKKVPLLNLLYGFLGPNVGRVIKGPIKYKQCCYFCGSIVCDFIERGL